MKKSLIIWIGIIGIIAGLLIWWGYQRKFIFRKKIQETVAGKTDGLYKLTYDSTDFDELNGDAILYNVKLGPDPKVLRKIKKRAALPGVLLEATIKTIEIKGLQSLDLLSGYSIDVNSIILNEPVITLTSLPSPGKKNLISDTTEIYERLLGKYSFLKSGTIAVNKGALILKDSANNNQFLAKNINIRIKDFIVDSLHNYKNITAYFVKNTTIDADTLTLTQADTSKNLNIAHVQYDTEKAIFYATDVRSKNQSVGSVRFDGLNIPAFIFRREFKSKKLTIDNVDLFFRKVTRTSDSVSLEIGGAFAGIAVDTLEIQKGRFEIKNKNNDKYILKDIHAFIYGIAIDSNGLSLERYLKRSSFRIAYLQYLPPQKNIHAGTLEDLQYNEKNKTLKIKKLNMFPVFPKEQLSRRIGHQADMFYIKAHDITAYNCDVLSLFTGSTLKTDSVDLKFDITVYNDKTIPLDSVSRIGNYPHEILKRLKIPLDVPVVHFQNSTLTYQEKSVLTGEQGIVYFTQIVGNVKNMVSRINTDKPIEIYANAVFMESGTLNSHWILPLNGSHGYFIVEGRLQNLDLTKLNPVLAPLSSAQVKSGIAKDLRFQITGNDTASNGYVIFLYRKLKVKLLEKGQADTFQVRKTTSFLVNILIQNKNTQVEKQSYHYKRDKYRSFFFLLWKSIFEGVKKTII